MKRILSPAVLVIGAMAFSYSPAQTGLLYADCAYGLGPKSSGLEMIACLQGIASQLERSEKTVQRLRSELGRVSTNAAAGVPSGAVAAFDLVKGCPSGWSEFKLAAGRFILGVGAGNEDENGDFLTRRGISEAGGEEEVTLTKEQMPRHGHGMVGELPSREFITGKTPDTVPTSTPGSELWLEGEDQPHNNMPPYIALYFCKKN